MCARSSEGEHKLIAKGEEGARAKIRAFLETNVGRIVHTDEIAEIAGIRDYQRRIRELRNEEGMQIRTYKDRLDLKPDEYFLESLHRDPVIVRNVSAGLRMEILERNGFTCQLCGRTGGDPDPVGESKRVVLVIDHVVPVSQGGTNERENLRVLCTACNGARSNIQTASETAANLLARIRRCPRDVQREVYQALERTFGSR